MWTIGFYRHEEGEDPARGEPVAIFSNLPEAVGDKILSAILPIVRAAESASRVKDAYQQALGALSSAVIDPFLSKRRKKGT